MKLTDSVLTSFIRESYPDFHLDDLQTYRGKNRIKQQYHLKISGTAGGEKLNIFSHYTPAILSKELTKGYKLILKNENGVIIIDLKKVSPTE